MQIGYLVFGFTTKFYKTAKGAHNAWKKAWEQGFIFQVYKLCPDHILIRWWI